MPFLLLGWYFFPAGERSIRFGTWLFGYWHLTTQITCGISFPKRICRLRLWLFVLMTSHSTSFVPFFILAWYLKTGCILLFLFGGSGPRGVYPCVARFGYSFEVQACTTFFCEVARLRAFVASCFSYGTWCVIACVTNSTAPPTFRTCLKPRSEILQTESANALDVIAFESLLICSLARYVLITCSSERFSARSVFINSSGTQASVSYILQSYVIDLDF